MQCKSELNIKIIRKNCFSLNPKTPPPQIRHLEGCFVSDGKKYAKNMCCIDCRNQKRVLNPTKIFCVQGNQENKHRCATLADTFSDPETGGVNDVERLLFYYLLNIIREILLILLKNDFYSL